jgi:hypothetical protein
MTKSLLYGYYNGGPSPVETPIKIGSDGSVYLASALTLDPTNLALDASVQTLITDLLSLYSATVKTPGTNANVVIGATHAESGAITATRVRLCATSACYIAFGSAPVADTNAMVLAANVPEVFVFTSGQKVSCLQVSAAGVLSITPV